MESEPCFPSRDVAVLQEALLSGQTSDRECIGPVWDRSQVGGVGFRESAAAAASHLQTDGRGDGSFVKPGLDIVCFSANDWSDIPSSKFHIMRYLGERNRVLFVDTV